MRRSTRIVVVLICLAIALTAEAGTFHSSAFNYGGMVTGLFFILCGWSILPLFPVVAAAGILSGGVVATMSIVDESGIIKKQDSSFIDEINGKGEDLYDPKKVMKLLEEQEDRFSDNDRVWDIEEKRRAVRNKNAETASSIRNLFGVKSANAGELESIEPLQPIEEFLEDQNKRQATASVESGDIKSTVGGGIPDDLIDISKFSKVELEKYVYDFIMNYVELEDGTKYADYVKNGFASDYSDPVVFLVAYCLSQDVIKLHLPELVKRLQFKALRIYNPRLEGYYDTTCVRAELKFIPLSPNAAYNRKALFPQKNGTAVQNPMWRVLCEDRIETGKDLEQSLSARYTMPRIRLDNGVFAPSDIDHKYRDGWGWLWHFELVR